MTAVLINAPVTALAPTRRRRLLLVAYCFPPVGGAGVQRPVKWVKYLQRSGWDVTVLTPANPSVPAIDTSLEAEIPPETNFVRPRTWEPSYRAKQSLAAASPQQKRWMNWPKQVVMRGLRAAAALALQPDPQILWYWNAVREATTHLRAVPHDAILATAPPFSNLLVGATLQQRFGLPLVLDYRDEWDLTNRYFENAQRDPWSQFVQERMQQRVLRRADAVIATTESSAQRLRERLAAIRSSATSQCIYNGFDEDDFAPDDPTASVIPAASPGTFRLVYTGTLWTLTNVAPVVRAIELLQSQYPNLAPRLEFVGIGRKTAEQRAELARLTATGCRFVDVDYCNHSEALAWLRSADALCLLLTDVPGAERVVPAKLFEYLAAEKEVLAVLPEGEANGLIRRFHPESAFGPQDIEGIAYWFAERLAVGPRKVLAANRDSIADFSRARQAERLRVLLEALTERSRLPSARAT